MAKATKDRGGRLGNTFKTSFSLVRLLDSTLVSSNIDYYAEMEFAGDSTPEEQSVVLIKMKNWIDLFVDECIAYCPSSDISVETIAGVDNHKMMCPDEPYDHVLLALLHAKINAIGGDTLSVAYSHLTSDYNDGFGVWLDGDPDGMLPSLTEWMGKRTYFNQPWWYRGDGSMIDKPASDDDDVSVKPEILIDLDMDLHLSITTINGEPLPGKEPAEIITPNFKPTIVQDD
jgi:hypothetical protein